MQWKEENRALFAACLNGLEDEPMVRAMDAIPQHGLVSRFQLIPDVSR